MSKGAALRVEEREENGDERGTRLASDGDTTEAELVLDSPDIGDSVGGGEDHRLGDESVLVPASSAKVSDEIRLRRLCKSSLLDCANHSSLHDGWHVVVDDSHTSVKLQR